MEKDLDVIGKGYVLMDKSRYDRHLFLTNGDFHDRLHEVHVSNDVWAYKWYNFNGTNSYLLSMN